MRGRNSKQPVHHEINLLAAPPPLRLVVQEFEHVNLVLVGCGGTGSHLVSGLGALACELRERGTGVSLTLVDPDLVELKNVGRQLFMRSDVGQNKARVLAGRLTAAFQVPVDVYPSPVEGWMLRNAPFEAMNILIGAVDNSEARRVLHAATEMAQGRIWWLDCGNEDHSGQVAIGNVTTRIAFEHAVGLHLLDCLPAVSLVYPDLLKTQRTRRKNSKDPASCAELTAAGEQSLMSNRLVAAWALSLLHDLVISRDLGYFALAFNAQSGGTTTWNLDLPTLAKVTGLEPNQLQGGKHK